MKSEKDILIGCLCALGCEFLFGCSYLITKNATAEVSMFTLLGWRFTVAFLAIGFCAVTGIIKVNLKGKDLKPLFFIALLCPVIYFLFETVGISKTTASESGIMLACIPIASVIASTLILKKRPNNYQIAGISVTLIGVLFTVFAVGGSASFSAIGYIMLVLCVIAYALYSVYVEKAEEYTGGEVTFFMLTVGAVVFVSAAVIEALINGNLSGYVSLPFHNMEFLISIIGQGLGCSVMAFFLVNIAISKIGVNRTSSFIGVSTVVSIVSGIIVLHEQFTLMQIIGAVIILAGVYIANFNQKNQ